MNFFQNKLNGLDRRIRCIKYGMFYFRNSHFRVPQFLLINGKKKDLRLDKFDVQEFTSICIDDCYHLSYLKRKLDKVDCIVDVGANQGMFLIAARQCFPKGKLTGYEPNQHLKETLDYNSLLLEAEIYYEAVMEKDCKVSLNFTKSDLATTAHESAFGNVPGTSLKRVIERSGSIDILKLDCEGGEWQLLGEMSQWKNIRALCLEYHLWGTESPININGLLISLNQLGFKIKKQTVLSPEQGIIVAINKEFN